MTGLFFLVLDGSFANTTNECASRYCLEERLHSRTMLSNILATSLSEMCQSALRLCWYVKYTPFFKDLVTFLVCCLENLKWQLWLILPLNSTGLDMPSSKVHDRILLHLSSSGMQYIETIKWTVLSLLQSCKSPRILGSNIEIRGGQEGNSKF